MRSVVRLDKIGNQYVCKYVWGAGCSLLRRRSLGSPRMRDEPKEHLRRRLVPAVAVTKIYAFWNPVTIIDSPWVEFQTKTARHHTLSAHTNKAYMGELIRPPLDERGNLRTFERQL